METDTNDSGGAPPSVPRAPQRVVQLLETLATGHEGWTLTRLSQALATPKSSLLNLLRALEQAGYVESSEGLHRLGPASRQLAAVISGGDPLLRLVRPALRRLSREAGETAMLGIATSDRRHAMYVESVESRNALSFAVPIGRPLPLYCTAMGRVYLAFQQEREQREYLSTTALVAFTPHTTVKQTELKKILAEVRSLGYSATRSQMSEGIDGLSAPVFDRHGSVQAMITLGAPTERIDARRAALCQLVQETGMEMSQVLEYRGAYPPRSVAQGFNDLRV